MSANQSLPESFGITAVRAFRSWDFDEDFLRSAKDHEPWPLIGAKEAICPNGCAVVPSHDLCGWQYDVMGYRPGRGCGLYATYNPQRVTSRNRPVDLVLRWPAFQVQWGAADAYGRVVMHEFGLKAEFMRVTALVDCGAHSARLAERYNVPCLSRNEFIQQFYTGV